MLEGGPTPSAPASPVPDLRVLTISPVSQNFLKEVGAWDLLDASRIGEFHGMKVWDYYSTGAMNFPNAYGWVVENLALQHANMARLSAFDSVETRVPTEVKQFVSKAFLH